MANGKPGRRSNWDKIVFHVGQACYVSQCDKGRVYAKSNPTRAAIERLGRALLHCAADAARQDKRIESRERGRLKRG